jgi:DNA polymerase alpha subunit A
MPQVQVALRERARGKNIRVNDVMSYIVTGTSDTSESAAKRAYTPQDVMKANSELKPDVEWYLIKQIFPPVERLCAPITGTDPMHLAECLGLDTRKYAIGSTSKAQDEKEIHPLESQIDDSIRFADAQRLSIRCRGCKEAFTFEGLSSAEVSAVGMTCPNSSCGKSISTLSVAAQLESQIRTQAAKYYEGWLVCDDTSCGNRTKQMSVYGHRCLGPKAAGTGCLGRMSYEYSDKELYNQLLYFASLWDLEKAKSKAKVAERGMYSRETRIQFERLELTFRQRR